MPKINGVKTEKLEVDGILLIHGKPVSMAKMPAASVVSVAELVFKVITETNNLITNIMNDVYCLVLEHQ